MLGLLNTCLVVVVALVVVVLLVVVVFVVEDVVVFVVVAVVFVVVTTFSFSIVNACSVNILYLFAGEGFCSGTNALQILSLAIVFATIYHSILLPLLD